VREIGVEMNVTFDDAALAELHRSSGGHVDLVRRISSRALAESPGKAAGGGAV
jgi:hypothetical protein